MQANNQATMHCRWKDTHPTKPNLLYLLHDTVVVHIGVQSSFVSPARPKGKAYGTVHTRMTAEELQMLSLLFSPLLQFCYDAGKHPNQHDSMWKDTQPYETNCICCMIQLLHIGVQKSIVSPARPKGKAYGTVHTLITAEELQMRRQLFS